MLQQASKLALFRCRLLSSAAAAAAATCCSGSTLLLPQHTQQLQQLTWASSRSQQQWRSNSTLGGIGSYLSFGSPATSGSSEAATVAAAAEAAEAAAAEAAAEAAGAGDGTPAELLEHADAILDVSEIATAATIAAAQGSVWTGTRWFIDLLLWTHDSCGLPWLEAIVATNVIVRLMTIPVTYMSQRTAPSMKSMRQDTQNIVELANQLKKAKTAGEYAMLSDEFFKARQDFNERYPKSIRRASYLTPVFGGLQVAVFISQFSAINTLTHAKLPSLTYEGGLWFPDLTLPDPWYGLPVLCAVTTWAMMRSPQMMDAVALTGGTHAEVLKKVMMAIPFTFILTGGWVSSAVAVLWTTNSLFGMAQNAVLGNARIRKAIGLPPVVSAAGAAGAAGAAAGGSSSSSSSSPTQSVMDTLLGKGSSSSSSKPQPAGAAGAPPPGSKKAAGAAAKSAGAAASPVRKPGLAVSYVQNKPRKRRS